MTRDDAIGRIGFAYVVALWLFKFFEGHLSGDHALLKWLLSVASDPPVSILLLQRPRQAGNGDEKCSPPFFFFDLMAMTGRRDVRKVTFANNT